MHQFIQKQWQKRGLWAWLLSPLSVLVCVLAWLKRQGFRRGIFQKYRMKAPVIVVGNLTVGGTGKTPLVIHLCMLLETSGYRPGIVSRGYKSKNAQQAQWVTPQTPASVAGDEALLLTQRTGRPVMIGANRAQSAIALIEQADCDIIISDDGFQHLKLYRDIDIIVRDAARGYGNGWCLPSGPLREPFCAQDDADFVVHNGGEKTGKHKHYPMALALGRPVALGTKEESTYNNLSSLELHAVAAIGNPERFFLALELQGLSIIKHSFRDHHAFSAEDLNFGDDKPIIMTEKDAVKCTQLPIQSMIWVAPVTAALSDEFDEAVLAKLSTTALSY